MLKRYLKKIFFVFLITTVAALYLITANIDRIGWELGTHFGEYIENEAEIDNYKVKDYSNANEEWEIIDNNIYISKRHSFYFIDDGLISLIIISRPKLTANLLCIVQESNRKPFLIKAKLVLLQHQMDVASYELTCKYPASNIVSYDVQLYLINKLRNETERTKSPIKLKVKTRYRMNFYKNSNDFKTALCGPLIFLNSHEKFEEFKKWLEINAGLGYQKIIIYVILISNEEMFNELIMRYKEIVEVRPYKIIPNVNYLKDNNPFYTPELYLKIKNDPLHWVHHRAIINGCFLSCFKDYERVSVIDIDEIIIPNTGKIQYLESTDLIEDKIKCEFNINNYIDSLNLINFKKKYTTKRSLRFYNAYYLDSELIRKIFYFLKLNVTNEFVFKKRFDIIIKSNNGFFSFSVLNEKDFKYLKHLINFYDNYYMSDVSLINFETDVFHRIWMIQETRKEEFGLGKVDIFKLIN